MKGWSSSVGRKRVIRKLSPEERYEKKKTILAALAKASEDSQLLAGNANVFDGAPHDYYTFTHDEVEALVNGDMEKIERWVSNMDRNHASRLLHWLIKERW